jgi:hypothetical protein
MCWTSDELFEALTQYKQVWEAANLAAATVNSNVNYARMFLRWRIHEFRTSGDHGPAREPRAVCAEIPDLEEDLRAYEEYLRSAGRQAGAVRTYVGPARQFVDSLGGRFVPGARRNGRSRMTSSSQRTAADASPVKRSNRPLPDLPSDAEVLTKRKIYAVAEPRDIAYRVARHLIEHADADGSQFSSSDGVAILLMSWNAGFYRFRPGQVRSLAADLDRLIATYRKEFEELRTRSVASFDEDADLALWPGSIATLLQSSGPLGRPRPCTSLRRGSSRSGTRLSPKRCISACPHPSVASSRTSN